MPAPDQKAISRGETLAQSTGPYYDPAAWLIGFDKNDRLALHHRFWCASRTVADELSSLMSLPVAATAIAGYSLC